MNGTPLDGRRPQRRQFCLSTGLALASVGRAQTGPAVFRIAHLSGSGESASQSFVQAFRDGMRDLGQLEGRHYALIQRYAEGKAERLGALTQELIGLKPDVLLTSTTPAAVAAKLATRAIPIVVVLVADPVGAGIVQSLARPGGNITGITNIVAELAGKRLELLKEMIPAATQVAVFVNPDTPNAPLQLRNARAAARSLRIDLRPILEVRQAADLERAFQAAVNAHAGAAIRMIDPLVFMLREQTAALAIKHRLAVIYPSREDVLAGGLASYGTDLPAQYRQAAALVLKVLKGANPADLPVEQPTKFELIINLKTARALGLTLPQSLLLRADEVLQ